MTTNEQAWKTSTASSDNTTQVNDDSPTEKSVIATLSGVTASADSIVQIEDFDLEVRSGEIIALLGPNASGRSLVLNLLLGLIQQSEGEVRVFGAEPETFEVRERVGSAPYSTAFPGRLRVDEIVEFVISHFKNAPTVDEYLDRAALRSYAQKKVSDISRTEERWLAVMLAFAGNPDIVLLDHPTRGMDLEWRIRLWQILREFADHGGTVVINTEASEHVQIGADRVLVMCDGSIIASATPTEIIDQIGQKYVTAPDGDLDELEITTGLRLENRLPIVPTSDPDRTVQELIEQGVSEENLHVSDNNLEHAVLQLIQRVER